jgi:hypothetical protein
MSLADEYGHIPDVHAELKRDGLPVPHYETTRRAAHDGTVRAVRVGTGRGRLLVHREDVRALVTGTPVRAS